MSRKKWARWCNMATIGGIMTGLLLPLTFLYLAVIVFTFHVGNYPQQAPFGEMAAELIAYLRGNLLALSKMLFTEREILHMEDVRHLFVGGKWLAAACAGSSAVLLGIAGVKKDFGRYAVGLRVGLALFVGAMGMMALWAMIDFTGWFTVMHEIAFTNDLWLLDPAESMLIRMLPQTFFEKAVLIIGSLFALGLLALYTGAGLIRKKYKGK